MNLLTVKTFVIPRDVAEASLQVLRHAGERGMEAFVAWAGVQEGERFLFRRASKPAQTAHRTPRGLLVTIDGDALFELNRYFNACGEVLACQMHAHPGSAYHSGADDDLAFVTVLGGISIVVPDFARGGLEQASRWAIFQLQSDGGWLPPDPTVEFVLT